MNLPDATINFGKHRGQRVSTIARLDPGYLRWMLAVPAPRLHPVLLFAVKSHVLAALQSEVDGVSYADLA